MSAQTNPLANLSCPVCYGHFSPPIYVCRNGHAICPTCTSRMLKDICPVCRGPMENHRAFYLEAMFEVMVMPCRNKVYGCTFEDVGRNVLQHQDNCCSYEPVYCPRRNAHGCLWEGLKTEVTRHYRECVENPEPEY